MKLPITNRSGVPGSAWGLASLAMAMLMASLDTSIANIALPTLAETFSARFEAVQWVVLAYLLSLTGLIVGAGRLGDLVGRKPLLIAGLGLFVIASLLCSLAPGLPVLIAGRALQGLGAAAMLAMSMAMASETVGAGRVGRAMGVLGTMSALGTSLGPSLGGWLIDGFGWRTIFLLNVPLGLVTIALALRALPVSTPVARPSRPRFDLTGALLLVATLSAFALAMTNRQPVLLIGAVLAACLFIVAQRRASSPLIRLSMLRDRRLSAGFATSALVATVMMATLVVGPFYLGGALGLETAHVGLVMAAGPLAAAMMGVPAGRIVDRFGGGRSVFAALVGLTAGLAALARAPDTAGYIASIMVVTMSYALFQTANNSSVLASAQTSERGVVAAMLSLSRNLGLISGAAAMGALFASASAAHDVARAAPASIVAGMRVTFVVASLLGLCALAIAVGSTFRRKTTSLAPDTGGAAPAGAAARVPSCDRVRAFLVHAALRAALAAAAVIRKTSIARRSTDPSTGAS